MTKLAQEGRKVAVHATAEDDKILEYIALSHFSEEIQQMYQDGNVWGAHADEDYNVVIVDIWQDEHDTDQRVSAINRKR